MTQKPAQPALPSDLIWEYFSLVEHALTLAQSPLDLETFLDTVQKSHYSQAELSCVGSFLLSNHHINNNLEKLQHLVSFYNLEMRGALLGQLVSLEKDVCAQVLSFCPFSQTLETNDWERHVQTMVKHDNCYLLERYMEAYPPSRQQKEYLMHRCVEVGALQCFTRYKTFVGRKNPLIMMAILWQSKVLPHLLDGDLIPTHIGRQAFKILHYWSVERKRKFYAKTRKSYSKFGYQLDLHFFMGQWVQVQRQENTWWEYLSPHLTHSVRTQMIKARFFSSEVQQRHQLSKILLEAKPNTSAKKRM